jgi:hypothetical protein
LRVASGLLARSNYRREITIERMAKPSVVDPFAQAAADPHRPGIQYGAFSWTPPKNTVVVRIEPWKNTL